MVDRKQEKALSGLCTPDCTRLDMLGMCMEDFHLFEIANTFHHCIQLNARIRHLIKVDTKDTLKIDIKQTTENIFF